MSYFRMGTICDPEQITPSIFVLQSFFKNWGPVPQCKYSTLLYVDYVVKISVFLTTEH